MQIGRAPLDDDLEQLVDRELDLALGQISFLGGDVGRLCNLEDVHERSYRQERPPALAELQDANVRDHHAPRSLPHGDGRPRPSRARENA